MVSRRNFISIGIMMLVLLFLFLFSHVVKEQENNYDENEYVCENPLSGADQWTMTSNPEELTEQDYILFLGREDSQMGKMIQSWCTYGKRQLYTAQTMQLAESLPVPDMILIDTETVDVSNAADWLKEMAGCGCNLVFCNLPNAKEIEAHADLMELLGVLQVRVPTVQVEGIRLFSGFLIGGEAVYKAQTEKEQKMQDLELSMPWYTLGSGTSIYMVGMMDEAEYEREEFPPIIWKNTYENGTVFAINGDYMSDLTGLGILSAIDYQLEPYTLYPVVNAHNTTMVNYPGFAEENADKIQELYSRSVKALYRDVMWPGLTALSESVNMKLTFAISPQYYYGDELSPSGDELIFYLKQMKEIKAEAGISLDYAKDVSLEEKISQDKSFLEGLEESYIYSAYCLMEECPDDLEDVLLSQMEDVQTISCLVQGEEPLVSYYNDEVTLQVSTGDPSEYTYSDNLRFRSLETALGYSNIMVDLGKVIWPESEKEQWENYFDDISSNLSTYWTPYKAYDSTTLTESDSRIRSFLNLGYSYEKTDDKLTLKVTDFGEEAWFVFRSRGEDIARITGGKYTKMEENVFLIQVTSEEVVLELEASDEQPEFLFPGEAGY